MKIKNPTFLLALLLLFLTSSLQAQDCDNDTTPPLIVCTSGLNIIALEGSGATIFAEDINLNSSDECGPVTLRLVNADDDDGTPPATTSVTFPNVLSTYTVVLYAIDPSGNFNTCFSAVNVIGINGEGCTDDTEAPVINCLAGHSAMLDSEGIVIVSATDFLVQVADNCDPNPVLTINSEVYNNGLPQGDFELIFAEPGFYEVELWAIDAAGNSNFCITFLEILEFEPFDCEGDETAPIAVCNAAIEVSVIPDFGAIIWAQDIDEGSYDDCSAVELFINLSDDDTGTPPITNSIQLPPTLGTYTVVLYAVDAQGNFSPCFTQINVTGFTDDGCTTDGQAPVPTCYNNITVELGTDGTVTVFAQDIILDSNDNCDTNPTLSINLLTNSTGSPQGNNALQLSAPGTYVVESWTTDDFGNTAACISEIIVLEANSCTDDTTLPVAICDSELTVEAIPDFGVLLWAQDIDDGSYDDCSTVQLFVTLADDDTGVPPTANSLQLPAELGTYVVLLYAVDAAGNFNTCWTEVTISGFTSDGCTTDEVPPAIFCYTNITLNLSPATGTGLIYVENIVDSVSDDCDANPALSLNLSTESTGAPQGTTVLLFDTPGIYEVETWAVDDFGNAANCLSTVTVQLFDIPNCDDDIIAPSIVCDGTHYASTQPGESVTINISDIVVSAYDACGTVSVRMILEEDSDGTLPTSTSVELPPVAGWYNIETWAVDESGNTNICINQTYLNIQRRIKGQVYADSNENCELDAGENGNNLTEWTILVSSTYSNRTATSVTNNLGEYDVFVGNWPAEDLVDVEVALLLPDGLTSGCVTTVTIPEVTAFETFVDFAAVVVEDCLFTAVDVSAPFLRRCFNNNIFLHYSNYSTEVIEDATITVDLDPFIELTGASVPFNDLGNNSYELIIGFIAPTSTGTVLLETYLSCEAELGATHCVEATILPFTCLPANSFAELTVTGECDPANNQVNFTIANTGNGNMAAAQNYRIVEDVIMYMTADPIQLDAGDSEQFTFPANGATWRLEIDQEATFPYGGIAAAFVEGCGGFTPGIATQFLLENGNPNIDQMCFENIGSWDPNDKQALPRGYGEQHYIKDDTPLEYLIRFQNTGTDTAFNVRIEDQLSEHLDPTSIVPGAASHAYRMELKENGQLFFHFDDIMLPDSSINFEASNGFVQFSIRQQPDNAIGTIIENTAGIYFDFNEAVVTNTVMHTIGEDFILVQTRDILLPGVELTVAPNPLQTTTKITLHGIDLNEGQCLLYDSQGRLIGQQAFNGQELELTRDRFGAAGLYFYRLVEGSQVVAQGKLMVK